ncbi:MAG: hypothetical protein AAGI48_10735 [Verrucomicrobiota bacterium]
MSEMRFPSLAAALGLLVLSALPAAEQEPGKANADPSPAELIELLGDESYPVREAATYDLWALGEEARELFKEAVGSANPEIAVRARGVLRKVELGILPDSPPEVVALVVRYDQSNPEDRRGIIRRLKQLRAWRQVLRIHELERDPATLEEIADEMRGVSVEAARELLAGDEPDFSKAREMLEMGRPEPAQLMALAEFHRVAGSLEAELEKAASLEGEPGHLWRYALLAAKGDLLGAADEAESAGLGMVGARLRALAGDPLPWVAKVGVPAQQIAPDALPSYRNAVVRRWKDRPVSEDLREELVDDARMGDIDDKFAALSVLYAIGECEAADRELIKLSPELAFFYFENNERLDEALLAMDLDPKEPDFKGWAKERFKVVIEDPDNSDEELGALMTAGWFFERRGLDELADEIFTAPLVQLGREDPETFIDRTAEMFSIYSYNRVVGPVLKAAGVFAEDDPVKMLQMRDGLFGEGVHIPEVWNSLADFDPGLDEGDRLRLMADVLGLAPDRSGKKDEWWAAQIKQAREGREADRPGAVARLLCSSAYRRDAEEFLETSELMREIDLNFSDLGVIGENFRFLSFEIDCLVAAGRWDEMVERRLAVLSRTPTEPIRRAYLATALRQAGREDEAEEQEAMVERLALGDSQSMRGIARAYSSCGDYRRAGFWWRKAASQTTGTIQEFMYAVSPLLDEAREEGDWQLAASLGEVQLLFHLMMGDQAEDPWTLMRERLETDMARALSMLERNRPRALEILQDCHDKGGTDGSMADYFFPGLRQMGLIEQHDEWFEKTWAAYAEVLKAYPGSHNTRNTAAWTAARANRRLDEAEVLVKGALEVVPDQSAYLDTYGEVWFCRRNRDKALEWSRKALLNYPGEATIIRQFERFRQGEFPR